MASATQTREIERPLPMNVEAERAVLGSVLLNNANVDEALMLASDDFFLDQHRKIFAAYRALRENNEPIDLVTVTTWLHAAQELEAAGGAAYVSALADGMLRVTSVPHYTKLVREKALLRRVIHTAQRIQELAFEGAASAESVLGHAAESVIDLAIEGASEESEGKTYFEAAVSLIKQFEDKSVVRVMTGIFELDKITGGFRDGELVTLTASTGVGKTLMAQQIRRWACNGGLHSLYCSGEMTAEHLLSRELATEAGVKHWKMRNPEQLSPEDYNALVTAAAHECKKCRIVDGELSLNRIRLASRRKKRAAGLDLLIVDYDELVDAPGRNEIEQQRNLIRGLKAIAMELRIPVIVISQLRKSLDKDEAKKPTLERIYGSGAKSKHSSFIIFVDREWVRELKGDETEGRICILKARDGRLGQINVKFDLATLRFADAPTLADLPVGRGERRRKAKDDGEGA